MIYLHEIRGTQAIPIDSAQVDAKGEFKFPVWNYERGFYRLARNDSDQVDIILTPAEPLVMVNFSGVPLQEHISVVRSEENQRLWKYKATSREAQAKLFLINLEREGLAQNDSVGHQSLDGLAGAVLHEKDRVLARITAEAPKSYFAKVIKASRMLQASGNDASIILKAVDLSDLELLRSSLFPQAVNAYIQATPIAMEEQLMDMADTLILHASQNSVCRNYMIGQMLDLFARHGPELALQHVVDQYIVGDTNAAIPVHLSQQVDELKKVGIGATVPSVTLPNLNGATVGMDSLFAQHPYTILFFYSSTCEHCHDQVPGLHQLYKEFQPRGLEIVGIALDLDTALFQRTLLEENITWPCYSEFDAWGSPAAKALQVKATPMFFIIDQQRRIVAKPLRWQRAGEFLLEHLPAE